MKFDFLEQIVRATCEAVRPAERLTVSQAAEKYRYLDNAGSYVGYWDNRIAPYLVEPMDVLTSQEHTGMIFAGPARCGKALALDTPIATPAGWTTMGEIKSGDQVFGRDGKPYRVVFKSEIFTGHDCYELEFKDGSKIVADAGHKWLVHDSANQNELRVLTTEYMASRVMYRNRPRPRFLVPGAAPVAFEGRTPLRLDPYVLGAWLGDGHNIGARITSSARDVDEMRRILRTRGCANRHSVSEKGEHTIYLSAADARGSKTWGEVSGALSALGLLKCGGRGKFIPSEYLVAAYEDRLALLQGLLDTDGSATKTGTVEYCTVEPALASGVRQILWSLGVKSAVYLKKTIGRDVYRVQFTPTIGRQYFRLKRKQCRLKQLSARALANTTRRSIVSITKVRSVPTACISVASPDHVFLAGRSLVPTHNTDLYFNWLTHTAKCDPADMMVIHMTQNTARDWSIGDLRKVFRATKVLGDLVVPGRQNMNVHDVRFISGMRLLVKWPTISELSGKTIPRMWLMDMDRMPLDVDKEGSPYQLAKKRATTFGRFGMTVAESSPGFLVEDPKWKASKEEPHEAPPTKGILALYNRGDRRRWYWPCPQCKTPFEPDFSLLTYPNCKDAMEAAEQAHMVCPHCGAVIHHDSDKFGPGKNELNQQGRWLKEGQIWNVRTNKVEGNGRRSDTASFWLKGTAAAFTDWKTLTLSYLKAIEDFDRTGAEESLKTTVNVDQGLPYTPRGATVDRLPEEFKSRAKDLGEQVVPEGVRFLVAAIDVQKNRFVVQVMGFGVGNDIWVIDRFEIKKSERTDDDGERYWVNPASYAEDWKLLVDQVICKTYPLGDGSGRVMQLKAVACDMHGLKGTSKNAYEFWRWLRDEGQPPGMHQRFQLVRGEPSKTAPRVRMTYPDTDRKDRHAGARGEIPVLQINSDIVKDQLSVMLDRTDPRGGMISFPSWLPDWFYNELTVEVRTSKGWENPRSLRNESWDLLAYAIALSLSKHIRIEQINWENPPSWAAEWDVNDLISDPNDNKRFAHQQKGEYDLASLAETLA